MPTELQIKEKKTGGQAAGFYNSMMAQSAIHRHEKLVQNEGTRESSDHRQRSKNNLGHVVPPSLAQNL